MASELGSAEALAASVRAGERSALELIEGAIERTVEAEEAVDAYLELRCDEARARASELDQRRARGEELGQLAGVPVAIKDNLSLAGHRLTCGSRILEGYQAPYTCTAVERLIAADAVILGSTNMDEFGMGSSCENSAFKPSRNPWDTERVPGGSSGGSAAAVASSSVPLAFGTDTGGSIRQPAALCGLVGMRPTYGRVSRYGLVAFASSLDQIGPLSRSVRDAALALSVIAGADARDSTSSARPVEPYLDTIEDGLEGLRVGTIREIDTDQLEPSVSENWRRSCALLSDGGAQMVEVSVPAIGASIATYYVLANSEASANLARFDGIRYGRRADAASLRDVYQESRSVGFGPEVKRRIMLGTYALSSGYYDAYYGRAVAVRNALEQQFEAAFEQADLLITPTSPTAAFGLGERVDDPLSMYLADIFTTPSALAGLPSIAVPSGLDDNGLPLSLQIMAPPYSESLTLRAARAFERAAGFDFDPSMRPS